MRFLSLVLLVACFVLACVPCGAKVLFLAHWNDTLTAEVSGGSPNAAQVGTLPQTVGGGYPFGNSMPAIGGLSITDGSVLGYESAGNILPRSGTVDFWIYLRKDFQAGPETPEHFFVLNNAPTGQHTWANVMALTYGGWNQVLTFYISDSKNDWVAAVGCTVDKWRANTKWHRIAISWDPKRIRMFVDGRLEKEEANPKLLESMPPYFYIGSSRGWQAFAPHTFDEFRILDRELTQPEAASDYYRTYEFTADDPGGALDAFEPIDISSVAKTPFEDDQANDQKGGWTDQGSGNDMRSIPRGDMTIKDMPFKIADGCVVLANAARQHYPQSVTIPVGKSYGGLLFLHTSAWMLAADRVPAKYVVRYDDGSSVEVPWQSHQNVGDWWVVSDLVNAAGIKLGSGGQSDGTGAYLFFWKNPNPDKGIKDIIFETANDEAMPILIAITGVKPGMGEPFYKGLSLIASVKSDAAAEFAEMASKYQSKISALEKIEADLKALKLPASAFDSFHGREAARRLDECGVYIKELRDRQEEMAKAIKTTEVGMAYELGKQITFVDSAAEMLKMAGELKAKAAQEKPMQPYTPKSAAYPKQAENVIGKAVRAQILLNGTWEKSESTDPTDPGKEWKPFYVPTKKGGWVRRTVAVPAAWKGKRVELWIEAAGPFAEVYINRRFAGRHLGLGPFGIDVTKQTVPGAVNEVMVYAWSIPEPAKYTRVPYGGFNGIHEDIWLRAMPRVSISNSDAYARLDSKNTFILTGKINNCKPGKTYSLAVSANSGASKHDFGNFTIKPAADGSFEVRKPWPKPILWGIGGEYGKPNLVFLRMKLADGGKQLDDYTLRTGFSKFEIRDKIYFYLNGKKIFLQGDHTMAPPYGIWGTTSRSFMTRYYRLAREANFNIQRPHFIDGGNTQPSHLDVADELGFLVENEGCGEGDYGDPVFRRNAEDYYTQFARKIRTHPSSVIFSLQNELLMSVGPQTEDAVKLFVHLEKMLEKEMPGVVLTEQGNNWRKEFKTFDVHYAMGKALENWQTRGDRPLINGEWSIYEGGYFDMNHKDKAVAAKGMKTAAEGYEKEIRNEKANGVAGTFPFPAYYLSYFCTSDKKFMGPWAEEISKIEVGYIPGRWYLPYYVNYETKVDWPALSGNGMRIDTTLAGTQADNINWFDPTRVEATPNDVYYAFQRAFDPMPPLRQFISPEAIVTKPKGQADYPVWSQKQGETALVGVLPDAEGRAWFEFPSAGAYRLMRAEASGFASKDHAAKLKPLKQKPGYGYIDRIRLGN